MAKTGLITFRVSAEEHERIKNEAKSQGYSAVSSYIRELALKRNLFIETKILETNTLIKKMMELKNE
mgnify:CR=1 FL=1